MDIHNKVVKIRNLPVETVSQAKSIIKMAMDDYDIIPFVPFIHKLRYAKNAKETTYAEFWKKNMKRLSREYYFGKRFRWWERISISCINCYIKPKSIEPIFNGDYRMIAMDMKAEMIAKLLLTSYENHFLLIDILAIRPLTFSEYVSLVIRYPETEPFVEAALGMSYERLFHRIFEHKTGTHIPLPISYYLADVTL